MKVSELDIETKTIVSPKPDFVETWFDEVKHAARLATQRRGEHPPTVKYLADDPSSPGNLIEGTINVSSFFINNVGKQKFAMLAPSLFSQLKAFAVLSIFESYALLSAEKLAEYSQGKYESMGDVPGSREVLMLTLQTRAQIKAEMLEMIRDANGTLVEVRREPINSESGDDFTGPMVGWVPDNGNEVN